MGCFCCKCLIFCPLFPECDRPIFRVRLFLSGFEEKLDIWKSNSKFNLATFWEILTNRRRKLLKTSHKIRLFIHLFSHNLEGKSCKSLVCKRSLLDSPLWRKNCSLNTQKQPLFWDNSNKNLPTRHLQLIVLAGAPLYPPKNRTKCPVTGQKISVCHTLGGSGKP